MIEEPILSISHLKENRMLLKENVSRVSKRDGKIFTRYDLTINAELIRELGWKKGQKLRASVKNNKLVVEKE